MEQELLSINNNHRKLQISLFHILKEFDRICTDNKIPYTLACGTLLGAVRHGGFIPWDDDADVYLLREDYDRFVAIASTYTKPDFFVMNSDTEPKFIHAFTRLCLKNSTMTQDSYKDAGFHQGIFLDIFPLDTITSDDQKLQEQFKKYQFIARLKSTKAKVPASSPIKYVLKALTRAAMLPISMKTLNKYTRKYASMHNGESSEHVGYFTVNYYDVLKKRSVTKQNIRNSVEVSFEGSVFSSLNNADEYLTTEYGDYMTFPPLDQQAPSHEAIELEFDEKYTSF